MRLPEYMKNNKNSSAPTLPRLGSVSSSVLNSSDILSTRRASRSIRPILKVRITSAALPNEPPATSCAMMPAAVPTTTNKSNLFQLSLKYSPLRYDVNRAQVTAVETRLVFVLVSASL
jgi:hypothetical protein